jgi:excisionase family DNA binding protein
MESLNELSINEFKSLVRIWVKEALFELQQPSTGSTEKDNKFLTMNEAASLLGLVPVTIYKKVSAGEIQALKRGKRLYFEKEALLKYIQDQQKPVSREKQRG